MLLFKGNCHLWKLSTKDNFSNVARIAELLKCVTGIYMVNSSRYDGPSVTEQVKNFVFKTVILGGQTKKLFHAATLEDRYLSISIIYLPVSLSVFPSIYLSIYFSIYLSTYQLFYLVMCSSHR